jgi:hypothetical protein
MLSGGVLTFQDDQGGTFKFNPGGPVGVPEALDATFSGGSGRLTASFAKIR